MADFNELIRIDPLDGGAYVGRAVAHGDLEQYAAAIPDFRRAVELDPNDVKAHEGLAHIQATCPVAEHRNGAQAVKSARRACDLTHWAAWDYLATLAAALATVGEFEAATKWQTKAMRLAAEDVEADREDRLAAQELLARYRSGRPYFEQSDVEARTAERRPAAGNAEDPVQRNARNLLQLYDTNRDGRLQESEYKQLGPSWQEADQDGDRALSLKENGYDPGPKRGLGTWGEFLMIHAATLWQCDCFSRKVFTTKGFRDLFVLVCLHVESRRVFVTPATYIPTSLE